MATILDVIVLRQWGDHGGAAFDLADPTQDHFRSSVVDLKGSADFYRSSDEAPDVAYVFQVVCEHNCSEWARDLVCTEVEEMDTFGSDFYPNYFSYHTLYFADVLAGFMDRQAVGGAGRGRAQQHQQNRRYMPQRTGR